MSKFLGRPAQTRTGNIALEEPCDIQFHHRSIRAINTDELYRRFKIHCVIVYPTRRRSILNSTLNYFITP